VCVRVVHGRVHASVGASAAARSCYCCRIEWRSVCRRYLAAMCKCESTAETSFDRLSWEVVEEELEADWLAMLTPLPSRCVFDNDAKASGGRWRGYADRPKRHAATATDRY
jgi:hypothetical protein